MADRWNGCSTGSPPPKKSTWKEYAERLLQFFTPPATYNPVRVAVIMDTYGERRIKKQKRRGQSGRQGRRIFITESEQSMPQGKNWSAFLSSGENKTELIRFLIEYYKSQAVICIFHQSCSYIPLCNIIWLISNVIWVTAVCMYLYTFTSNLFCTYYRSKLRIPLVITEICNT